MATITVVCREEGYPATLIYTVTVENPNDRDEVTEAVQVARNRDLGDQANEMELLFAFDGDLTPIADWRE